MGQGVKGDLWCSLLRMCYNGQIVSPHKFVKGGSRCFISFGLFQDWPH